MARQSVSPHMFLVRIFKTVVLLFFCIFYAYSEEGHLANYTIISQMAIAEPSLLCILMSLPLRLMYREPMCW